MHAEIDIGDGLPLGGAPFIQHDQPLAQESLGLQCRGAGRLRPAIGEDGQRTVANELQHIAARFLDR